MKYQSLLLVGVFVLGLAVASVSDMTAQRRYIKRMDDPIRASLPYSEGVLVGDTLYLSGRIGIDPKTGEAPDDLEREIRLALDSMKATLAEAGMTMDDLVTVTVYCRDLSLYDQFNNIYRTYFTDKFPARAFVGSGLLLRGGHFEIQGIAIKR